jgi:hypothetical protein
LVPRPKVKEKAGVSEKWVQRRVFGFEVSTCESVECIGPVQERDKMRAFVNMITNLGFPHKGRISLLFVQIRLKASQNGLFPRTAANEHSIITSIEA